MSSRALIQEVYQYSEGGKSSVITPPSGKLLQVYDVRIINRSGGNSDIGFLQKLSSSNFKVYTYDGSVATLVTDFSNLDIFDLTNGHGFIVQSDDKFGMFGFQIATGESGSPVYSYEYHDGTSFNTLTTIKAPSIYSSGEKHVIFASPLDFVPSSPAITGLESNKYTVKVVASTAPGTAVNVSDLWAGKFIDLIENAINKSSLQVSFDKEDPLKFEAEEGVLPYFSVPSANNLVTIIYRLV